MASVYKRGKSFSVVYKVDGKQTWESYKTEAEANKRKIVIDYEQMNGTFTPPSGVMVEEFLTEYVEIYGTTKWGHSTFNNNTAYIKNYINPNIGQWKMKDITIKKMDSFFNSLKTQPAVQRAGRGDPGFISDRCIYEINVLLSSAFDFAVEHGYIGKNPVTKNACPERKDKKREIWSPETALYALAICKDLPLLLCMHLSIACSMRIGEITGLKWPFISFGDIDNGYDDAKLQIDAQLQRISTKAFNKLIRKKENISFIFPALKENTKTMLVLKTLKTDASRRVVWLPQTTASILWQHKIEQEKTKELLGVEYQDYGMVLAHPTGRPMESGKIEDCFVKFIESHGLPKVDFHSLRHLSTTVKLKISKGDIKAVQGDTGHAQAKMVTDTYAHILDQERQSTAKKFETQFYGNNNSSPPGDFIDQLLKYCDENPEAKAKLKNIFSDS